MSPADGLHTLQKEYETEGAPRHLVRNGTRGLVDPNLGKELGKLLVPNVFTRKLRLKDGFRLQIPIYHVDFLQQL